MQTYLATIGVAAKQFLAANLRSLGEDWWSRGVVSALSYPQRQLASERGWTTLDDLDLAALLRVIDQNWDYFRTRRLVSNDARNWLKETASIRNRWAHAAPGERHDPKRDYRDLDTLALLAEALTGSSAETEALKRARDEALSSIQGSTDRRQSEPEPVASEWLAPGAMVRLVARPKSIGVVTLVLPGSTERQATVFLDGTSQSFYESQLEPHEEGTVDALSADRMRLSITASELLNPATSRLYSFNSGRIDYEPYQFRPVMKMINADRPRLLIADDVGVGKTIEAGLIIKELQARQPLESVLIVCPKPLVVEGKWRSELKRFDEDFVELDAATLRHCVEETRLEGVWPRRYRKAILPYSLLDERLLLGDPQAKPKRFGLSSLLPPVKFDLVIVDEAHHVRNRDTWRHRVVEHLMRSAEAGVLISATPVQTGSDDLFTLLRLLRPDLMLTPADFDRMREPNEFLADAETQARRGQPGWKDGALYGLELALETDWGKAVLLADPRAQQVRDLLETDDDTDRDRVRVVRLLQSLNTFSGLINRTRRRDIGNFTTRKPETVEVEFTPEQAEVHDDLIALCGRILQDRRPGQSLEFLLSTLRRQASSSLNGLAPFLIEALEGRLSEEELSEADVDSSDAATSRLADFRADIIALAQRAADLDEDPKLDALIRIVGEKSTMPNNKLLVFSTFRHTLAYLLPELEASGVRVGLVHGGIPDDERRDLRARFAKDKAESDAIDVLLSSEVGTEGLDNQFCDALVNYDIPWNPMRIEQRIGRIDRRGQKSESVSIKNLVVKDTVDFAIYDRCLTRIGVFRSALGGSEEILGELTSQMRAIAEDLTLSEAERDERLQQLADNKLARIEEQAELEEREAALFGLAVQKIDEDGVASAASPWLTPERLGAMVEEYLAQAGLPRASGLFSREVGVLRPDKAVRATLLADARRETVAGAVGSRWLRWLESSEPVRRLSFDPALADSDEVELLNALHPLVRAAARSVGAVPSGSVVSLRAESPELPPGRYPFAVYGWKEFGVRDSFEVRVLGLDPAEDRALADAVLAATDGEGGLEGEEAQALEERRYAVWADARETHLQRTQVHIDAQLASLRLSHAARVAQLEDQLINAAHENIRRMRESQLQDADLDYERRTNELEQERSRSDVAVSLVCSGVLHIEESKS